ncbi:MAG: MFS transporter [Planctomycetota bacterium]|jgi:dipeptide/tripeptide permease|nr:MFS transporter [Planctomycetota bacterium]
MGQLRSFTHVFWWANWMEVVERFAYYGLRTVLPIYMVLAYEDGGPQLSHTQKGSVFATWALVQSFVPIFTGGFADRYGYKLNICISTVVKIMGYLVMGYAIEMGAFFNGSSIEEMGGAAGGEYTYPIFYAGAILLAAGTAIFKPGVQGLIGATMPAHAHSFGWGIFYQMVNIGGFIGPLIAAVLQLISWKAVFLLCAVGIALNFIPLFLFAEPARKEGQGYHGKDAMHVIRDTIREFLRPRVLFFTLSFAGFWLMFYQLFDILPNFIDDWVDSRDIVLALKSFLPDNLVPAYDNGNLNQAWMINLDALMIMLTAFLFGYVTGKFKSLPTMVIGIFLTSITIYMLGMSSNGWWCLVAIGLFSIGEMVASPTKLRYMNEIAPKGKNGLFLGFANATTGIGWFTGSLLAGSLYEEGGDKVNLALQELASGRDRPAISLLLTEEEMVDAVQGLDDLSELEVLAGLYSPGSSEAALAQARQTALAYLQTDPDEAEALAKITDPKVYPRRLTTNLGIPAFETNLLLLLPGVPAEVDIPGLQDRLEPLWAVVAPTRDLKESELEDLEPFAGLLFEQDDANLAAAARWLLTAQDLPSTAEEFEARLSAQTHVVAPGLEGFRTRLLEVAASKDTKEEGDKYLAKVFQRSRVMEMASAEAGMSEEEFQQLLWDKYKPYSMWAIFAWIGVASGILLMVYDWGVKRYDRNHPAAA